MKPPPFLRGTLPWWDYLGGIVITIFVFSTVLFALGATIAFLLGLTP